MVEVSKQVLVWALAFGSVYLSSYVVLQQLAACQRKWVLQHDSRANNKWSLDMHMAFIFNVSCDLVASGSV